VAVDQDDVGQAGIADGLTNQFAAAGGVGRDTGIGRGDEPSARVLDGGGDGGIRRGPRPVGSPDARIGRVQQGHPQVLQFRRQRGGRRPGSERGEQMRGGRGTGAGPGRADTGVLQPGQGREGDRRIGGRAARAREVGARGRLGGDVRGVIEQMDHVEGGQSGQQCVHVSIVLTGHTSWSQVALSWWHGSGMRQDVVRAQGSSGASPAASRTVVDVGTGRASGKGAPHCGTPFSSNGRIWARA
jgi:hypothetical protein